MLEVSGAGEWCRLVLEVVEVGGGSDGGFWWSWWRFLVEVVEVFV